MTNMREKLAWSLVAALGLLIIASLAGVVRGGPLDPPGAPASTANGIDGRIPIDHLPFLISDSGSYVVTRDLQRAGGDGITVDVDNVTIDLNGFTLDGVSTAGLGTGIYAYGRGNLTVFNGVIRRWNIGIRNTEGTGGLFNRLQIDSNVYGSDLGAGGRLDASIVRSNTNGVLTSGAGGTVTNSTFLDNGTAILLQSGQNLVESNQIEIPAGGIGVVAGNFATIRRNYFGNPTTSGYVTIDLGSFNYVFVVENRITSGLTTGGSGVGNYIPYDTNNALTNMSQ